jgi:hypothetical protein
MHNGLKYPIVVLMMIVILMSACGKSTAEVSPSNPSTASGNSTLPSATPMKTAGKVELTYFHLAQRCVTCLCFEDRLNYITGTNFKDAIAAGKLVYRVVEIGKKENEPIVSKYKAYGSQLFINVIVDNKDNIREIQEIWSWKCPTDKPGFDEKLKNLIEINLKSIN